jgi:hypothetical protein
LDFSRIDASALLTYGDVLDMAEALNVDPADLTGYMAESSAGGGGRQAMEVGLVLAWIIGRKADPELQLETVQRTWRVEIVGADAGPPVARRQERGGPRRSPVKASPSRG